jgi:peptidoglycan/LPS O-acetylase OafA/YrhL
MPGSLAKQERYSALDALRFVLATWVAIGHLGPFPWFINASQTGGLIHIVDRALNTIVWGMPAVMAFFVISGFCIHMPFRDRDDVPLVRFYARRYLRVTVPMLVALGILYLLVPARPLWGAHSVFWESTLWSLLIEEIYYAVYPLLRRALKRFGWTPVLSISFVISIVTASCFPKALDWGDLGPLLTAVVLYPVWLLGARLSERAPSLGAQRMSRAEIWRWRLAVWSVMWVVELMHFHLHVSQVHTMVFFGAFAALWIRKEITYARHVDPPRWLTNAGAWSYSLYLMHPAVFTVYWLVLPGGFTEHPRLGWLQTMAMTFVASYVFYLLVERPSHRLARKIPLWPGHGHSPVDADQQSAERIQPGQMV